MAKVQEYDANFRATGAAPGWTSRSSGRTRAWRGWHACAATGRTYLLGAVRGQPVQGRRGGRRPGRRPDPGVPSAATANGTASARSGCRQRCGSRTTAASRWPATGSRSCRRSLRRCGSAVCAAEAGSVDEVADEGTLRVAPTRCGGIVYGTAEGVSWMATDRVVMVSDKAKPGPGPPCRAKDQSIHIFRSRPRRRVRARDRLPPGPARTVPAARGG